MGNIVATCSCGKQANATIKIGKPVNRTRELGGPAHGVVSTLYGTQTTLDSTSLQLFEDENPDDLNKDSLTTEKSIENGKKKVQFDEETLRQQRLEYLKKYIHDRENKEDSALTKAVNNGLSLKAIQELIESGEDVDSRDQHGDPVLYTAMFYSQFHIVRLLLQYGCDVNSRNSKWDPIIYTALQTNRPDILRLVIEAGADIDCRNSKGDTPLYSAILSRQLPMIEVLLKHGADTNLRNTLGTSCLEEAMTSNQIDVLEMLIDAGADIDIKDKEGNTLLHVAMLFKQMDCLDVLLTLGADVNLPDKEGNPVVEMSILMHDIPSIKRLLRHGADVNVKNNKGIPVFFKAIYRTGYDVIELLLNNGVDVNSTDSMGKTATFVAIDKNNADVIKLLANAGIDNNIQSSEGITCLEYASCKTSKTPQLLQILSESHTVLQHKENGMYLNNLSKHDQGNCDFKDNFVSFCDRALFLSSKQSERHIQQWVHNKNRGNYWFSKVNIFCDHFHVDCIIDSRLQMAYSTLKEITGRRSPRLIGVTAVDTENVEDPHPFEADEPKAVTEFETLLTIVNRIREGFDINTTTHVGDSLLHLAIKYRHGCLLRYLLTNGGNMYKNNGKSISPLKKVLKNYDETLAVPLCLRVSKEFSRKTALKVKNVWSGWKCHCKHDIHPERKICSDELVMVADFVDVKTPLSFFFKGLQVLPVNRDIERSELEIIREYTSSNVKPFYPINQTCFLSYNWTDLFQRHRHLQYVYPSSVKSVYFSSETLIHKIKDERCIRLVCSTKGVIHIEENHFPDNILGYPTDCIEGQQLIAVVSKNNGSYKLVSFISRRQLDLYINSTVRVRQDNTSIPIIDSFTDKELLHKPFDISVVNEFYQLLPRAVITCSIDHFPDDYFLDLEK